MQPPLHQIATILEQHRILLGRFDALGQCLHTKAMGKLNHGADGGGGLR